MRKAVVPRTTGAAAPLGSRPSSATLAVVDMGSNSFRLEIGRVEGDQIYRLDTQRETLRIGAGIDGRGFLTAPARRAALACLARFAERLSGFDASAVRAVATNAFRIARNAPEFLAHAERTLGFPIDVISGHEEARLIYLGVAHLLPPATEPRLVVDIGGGSTEFIVGRGLEPLALESLKIGCVAMSQRFFPRGELTRAGFDAAETAARAEIEALGGEFDAVRWHSAHASSGTALALAEILVQNNLSTAGITPEGLARLRERMVAAGHVSRLRLEALKAERAPVLAGGFAIMSAALEQLNIARIDPVGGALRLGALYDLLGRSIEHDARDATVQHFIARYRLDRDHAMRIAAMAVALFHAARPDAQRAATQTLERAALLHETGLWVSHTGFHKHGAYILRNADMPGFSAGEQERLSQIVLACRGSLDKVAPMLVDLEFRAQACALRLAILFHHARRPIAPPPLALRVGSRIHFDTPPRWLKAHPLTAHLLEKEAREWKRAGYGWSTAPSRARRNRAS
jgi:exopolyphosphatase/guanosine-5'-triphosphate,3'-diphosphate pyrophosphatase